jgi:hypothetical protein
MNAHDHDDRELTATVHQWLHLDDDPTPDRRRQVHAIVAAVDRTGQRHRWWPLVPLVSGRGTAVERPRPRLAPASLATAVSVSLLVVLVAVALLGTDRTLQPVMPGTAPIDPADQPAIDRLEQLWSGSLPISAIADVYSDDAVHTVVWTDQVERFNGTDAIAARILVSERVLPRMHEYRRLPDGLGEEHRYLIISLRPMGVPCLLVVAEDRITRHDCIFPIANGERLMATGPPPDDVDRDELEALIYGAWNGDESAFRQVVAPSIEHRVAFDDGEQVSHFERYLELARGADGVEPLAPSVRLPAPANELRWAGFSDVGGGSLCAFQAREGQIVRHDCVVPADYT